MENPEGASPKRRPLGVSWPSLPSLSGFPSRPCEAAFRSPQSLSLGPKPARSGLVSSTPSGAEAPSGGFPREPGRSDRVSRPRPRDGFPDPGRNPFPEVKPPFSGLVPPLRLSTPLWVARVDPVSNRLPGSALWADYRTESRPGRSPSGCRSSLSAFPTGSPRPKSLRAWQQPFDCSRCFLTGRSRSVGSLD